VPRAGRNTPSAQEGQGWSSSTSGLPLRDTTQYPHAREASSREANGFGARDVAPPQRDGARVPQPHHRQRLLRPSRLNLARLAARQQGTARTDERPCGGFDGPSSVGSAPGRSVEDSRHFPRPKKGGTASLSQQRAEKAGGFRSRREDRRTAAHPRPRIQPNAVYGNYYAGSYGRPSSPDPEGSLARKLTRRAARQMAAARNNLRGGRPCEPRACPRCGTPCDSATQAAAHCVGPAVRERQAAARRQHSPESLKREYPKWKYHRTKPAVIVVDPEAEADLGDGWADRPTAFKN
jgi:hypothetical protein